MGIRLVVVGMAALLLGGCTVGRFVIWNFADIRDDKKFPSRPLPPAEVPFHYAQAAQEKGPKAHVDNGKETSFDDWLVEHKTVAFLLIRRDTIVYERYFKGYDAAHVHPSFSMAKSVVSMLIGCAIQDGYIRDVRQPITDFLPELRKNGFDAVTIEHVLQMTSGLDFNESYADPFGTVAKFYYGRNLRKYTLDLKLKHVPGTKWEYVSGDTQLLGMVLERALRAKSDQRTLTDYLKDRIWMPLGMEYESSWSVDRKRDGMEKAFCCISAPARDFAKLGSLYLKKGEWRGIQLVQRAWVETSTHADTSHGGARFYKYQWWLPSAEGDFVAEGYLGQYVYVDPARELVMVRLGSNNGGLDWTGVFRSLAKFYE